MRQFLLILCIAGLLVAVAGCLAPVHAGYLEGQVTLGPICPVERENVTCPVPAEAYATRKIVVSTEDLEVVEIVDLNPDGFYHVALSPGTYQVDINHVGIDHSSDVPVSVTILEGRTTELNIRIDTGIR